MTATDELRRLLDERGVDYRIECKQTRATFEPFNRFIVLDEHGGLRGTIDVYLGGACNCTWQFDCLTPEQAIADTLGNDGLERSKNGVAERGTCKWKPADFITEGDWWNTECGEAFTWEPYGVPNFCPNCGREVVE